MKLSLAQLPRDTPQAVILRESQDRVDGGVMGPQTGQFFGRQQGNMGTGPGLAQTQQGGGGHHGVTQPIDPAYQNPFRVRSAEWGGRRHDELWLPAPAGLAGGDSSSDGGTPILDFRFGALTGLCVFKTTA